MGNKHLEEIIVFDGQKFEKYKNEETDPNNETKETTDDEFAYAVDGVEVDKAQWQQRREFAMQRDMMNLGIRKKK